MLGQPVSMLIPQVVGFKLHGQLREGATATDVVLTVTQMLRKKGVVGKFVEFYGPGIAELALPDRATIANMAPEYGATMGFFPVDEETLDYLRFSGAIPSRSSWSRRTARSRGCSTRRSRPSRSSPTRSSSTSARSSRRWRGRSGRRIACRCRRSRRSSDKALDEMFEKGPDLAARKKHTEKVQHGDVSYELGHGAVVIAAITSCTNTSNPAVMLGAGLLAKKAIARGSTRQAVGEDVAGAGLARGDRVSERGGAAAVPGGARLPPGRLRLHHLHRQLGPAARRRSPRRSPRATWWSPACCRAIATSKGASTRSCA